jgi:NADPH-dependent ferric siderophore reductase
MHMGVWTLGLLTSEARIPLADAAGLMDRVIDYLCEHDISFQARDGLIVVSLPLGISAFSVETDAIRVSVEATEKGRLEQLRSVVASRIVELAGDQPPAIRWRGHEPNGETFASFREVRLKTRVDVAPHMRRLTFCGDDIARFASDDDLHVRMYFPPEGIEKPEWPRPAPDGRTLWPEPERRPATRYYTIRRIDIDSGEIDIDFVLHDHAGPGSIFATNARPGAICGMAGPLGRNVRPARWLLLVGDETALPAIARILECLPSTTSGHAFIEVADSADEVPLAAPSGIAITWLHRNGASPGSTNLLIDAVRTVHWPNHADVFAWIACEARAVRAIRDHLRKARNLAREQHLAVAYWNALKT